MNFDKNIKENMIFENANEIDSKSLLNNINEINDNNNNLSDDTKEHNTNDIK